MQWKETDPPTAKAWVRDMAGFLHLEKLKFNLKGNSEGFQRRWGPFLEFVSGPGDLEAEAARG